MAEEARPEEPTKDPPGRLERVANAVTGAINKVIVAPTAGAIGMAAGLVRPNKHTGVFATGKDPDEHLPMLELADDDLTGVGHGVLPEDTSVGSEADALVVTDSDSTIPHGTHEENDMTTDTLEAQCADQGSQTEPSTSPADSQAMPGDLLVFAYRLGAALINHRDGDMTEQQMMAVAQAVGFEPERPIEWLKQGEHKLKGYIKAPAVDLEPDFGEELTYFAVRANFEHGAMPETEEDLVASLMQWDEFKKAPKKFATAALRGRESYMSRVKKAEEEALRERYKQIFSQLLK